MTTFYNLLLKRNRLTYGLIFHNVDLGINLPQKHHPLFQAKRLLKFRNYPSNPFSDNCFFCEPTLKIRFFSEPP